MNTSKAKQYILPKIFPNRWASAFGEDKFGIWSEAEICGVIQRFRWISPGEFKMGSPDGELERLDDEKLHDVVLTHGFWLGDTSCTQELWQAVMGENPSEFKGAKKPMDSVSWDDCQKFIKKVHRDYPNLNLSLPTEAQWEYACRAGTQTPFSFGENITTAQVNYDGNVPYAKSEKGEYREQTVDVKLLPANQWGLYQMHGNVLEWCADWFGDYSDGKVINPTGPKEGVYRVLRGGSWDDDGEICRSASRISYSPVNRDYFTGFRFSPGQDEQA